MEQLRENLSKAATDQRIFDGIREQISSRVKRLGFEILGLERRAQINLIIGSVTTIIAAAVLGYSAIAHEYKFGTFLELASYYVPRLSVVVFIEVFAFFFLRLYRTTLTEIRLYQNELTSLAVRSVALQTAWTSVEDVAKLQFAKALLRTASLRETGLQVEDAAKTNFDLAAVSDLLAAASKLTSK